MRIAVDLDGVVVDFVAGWRAEYDRAFGKWIPDACLSNWDSIVTATHFESETVFFDWLRSLPGFWSKLAVLPGATAALETLAQRGHDLAFVTQRPSEAEQETTAWLKRRFGDPFPVRFVQTKWSLGYDLYVDDSPYELLMLSRQASAIAIRFVQPWNEGWPGLPALGWPAVVSIVDWVEEASAGSSVGPTDQTAFTRSGPSAATIRSTQPGLQSPQATPTTAE